MLADVSISTAFGPRGAVSPIGLHLFELCDDEYGRGQCQTASFRQLQQPATGVELMKLRHSKWEVVESPETSSKPGRSTRAAA